jgi:hypothetical protein
MKRGFKGLTEIAGLSDEEVYELVLGNWHKLNTVMITQPELVDIQRLLFLELKRGGDARLNVIERLRSAIITSKSRRSRKAAQVLGLELGKGKPMSEEALLDLGLEPAWVDKLRAWRAD